MNEKEIIKRINKIDPNNKYCNAIFQMNYWIEFFKNQKENLNIKSKILDYGSGGGYCVYIGRKIGYDVYGIDIDQEKLFNISIFNQIKKLLKIEDKIMIYDGEPNLPFKNEMFDYIISRNSIRKDLNFKPIDKIKIKEERRERNKKRIRELYRITKTKGTWFIIPPNNKNYINSMLEKNDRKIKILYTK